MTKEAVYAILLRKRTIARLAKRGEKLPSILEGIKVLSWAVWYAGPSATAMLGDLGAEIIKIEKPSRVRCTGGAKQTKTGKRFGDPLRCLLDMAGAREWITCEAAARTLIRGISLNLM